jgi:hypothetical protein
MKKTTASDARDGGPQYSILDEDRLAAGLAPLKSEYYGPSWLIKRKGAPDTTDPVVIIPDAGDGVAGRLARQILSLLNAGAPS